MARTHGATEWKISEIKEVCETLRMVAGDGDKIDCKHPQVQMLAIKLGRTPKNVRRLYRRVQKGDHPALNKKAGKAQLGQYVKSRREPTLAEKVAAILENIQPNKTIDMDRHNKIVSEMEVDTLLMVRTAWAIGWNQALNEATLAVSQVSTKRPPEDVSEELFAKTLSLI